MVLLYTNVVRPGESYWVGTSTPMVIWWLRASPVTGVCVETYHPHGLLTQFIHWSRSDRRTAKLKIAIEEDDGVPFSASAPPCGTETPPPRRQWCTPPLVQGDRAGDESVVGFFEKIDGMVSKLRPCHRSCALPRRL